MTDLITSIPFMLLLTTGTYLLGSYIYTKSGISILHPILISILTIIGVLKWLDIPYEVYAEKSALIDFLLGPSVVALGYTLYEQ
ncbi:MAG TPA: LrgB family protein, partial [Candidatus Gallibacteroides avistercoris]|nr:LrgB family protein [Candidatus Gallibacteroides avistercoris]